MRTVQPQTSPRNHDYWPESQTVRLPVVSKFTVLYAESVAHRSDFMDVQAGPELHRPHMADYTCCVWHHEGLNLKIGPGYC